MAPVGLIAVGGALLEGDLAAVVEEARAACAVAEAFVDGVRHQGFSLIGLGELAAQVIAFDGVAGELERALEGGAGFREAAESAGAMGAGGVEGIVIIEALNGGEQGLGVGPGLGVGEGDGHVEGDGGAVIETTELVVEEEDLGPIGLGGGGASAWTAMMAAWSW